MLLSLRLAPAPADAHRPVGPLALRGVSIGAAVGGRSLGAGRSRRTDVGRERGAARRGPGGTIAAAGTTLMS